MHSAAGCQGRFTHLGRIVFIPQISCICKHTETTSSRRSHCACFDSHLSSIAVFYTTNEETTVELVLKGPNGSGVKMPPEGGEIKAELHR